MKCFYIKYSCAAQLTPNHVELFIKLNNHILSKKEYEALLDLTLYELTIAEQTYLDAIRPSLNSSLYANWSSYNTGPLGYIRDEEANLNLSLKFLNRSFNQATKDLHKKIRQGKKISEEIKQKMSASHLGPKGGKPVILEVVGASVTSKSVKAEVAGKEQEQRTTTEIFFDSISSLGKELNISARTINR